MPTTQYMEKGTITKKDVITHEMPTTQFVSEYTTKGLIFLDHIIINSLIFFKYNGLFLLIKIKK